MPSASTSSPASPAAADDRTVDPVSIFVGELHAFERLLRSAFATGGRLQVALAEAHADQKLSAVSGHQLFTAISRTQLAVGEAMGGSAQAHRLAEALGKQLNIDPVAVGDVIKPPSRVFTGADGSHLDVHA